MTITNDPRRYIVILSGPLKGWLGSVIPGYENAEVIFAVVSKGNSITPPICFHPSQYKDTELSKYSKYTRSYWGEILFVVCGIFFILYQFFHIQAALYALLTMLAGGLIWLVW